MKPSLVLLAGPNGAGKTTLYKTRVAPSFADRFINADIIQRDNLRDSSMEAAYEAARIAETQRNELLDAGQSFVTETVFSHPSKLQVIEAARSRGYLVVVMHVGVETADLSVTRVRERRAEGGHDVPEDKIRARYERSAPLVRAAVMRADRGMVFDNSQLNTPSLQMLVFANGRLIQAASVLPGWIRRIYADDLVV